jgi:Cdc6-like AAA superfamily ATPase
MTHRDAQSIMDSRVDSYIVIAKIKYADKTADEIISIIENGTEELRFNSKKEKELFRTRWESRL